jgi:hypothetical protein
MHKECCWDFCFYFVSWNNFEGQPFPAYDTSNQQSCLATTSTPFDHQGPRLSFCYLQNESIWAIVILSMQVLMAFHPAHVPNLVFHTEFPFLVLSMAMRLKFCLQTHFGKLEHRWQPACLPSLSDHAMWKSRPESNTRMQKYLLVKNWIDTVECWDLTRSTRNVNKFWPRDCKHWSTLLEVEN